MRLRPFAAFPLAILIVFSACSASAQTAPDAKEKRLPWAIGAGLSAFNPDYDHGHLLGGTLWIGYYPTQVLQFLRGIGIEAEARDLNYGRSATQPADLREDVAEGGLIYAWRHFRKFHPYGKVLFGFGNTDEETKKGFRYHDSRDFISMGGGLEYRTYKNIWVRADYEYQSWPNFFKHAPVGVPLVVPPAGRLNPQGFTVGAMYHF
jgi:hypothetical protein